MHVDVLNIGQAIARFAASFDVKDWNGLQTCLIESVFTDYSDLRGTPRFDDRLEKI